MATRAFFLRLPKHIWQMISDRHGVPIGEFDTLRAKAAEILGSTSPLNLEPLRYLSQRWFSPQALTFPLPEGSCITANFA